VTPSLRRRKGTVLCVMDSGPLALSRSTRRRREACAARYVPALPVRFPADCDTEAMQVQGCINVTLFYDDDDDDDDDVCNRVVRDCHRTRVSHWL
jgi:hypothetical protein